MADSLPGKIQDGVAAARWLRRALRERAWTVDERLEAAAEAGPSILLVKTPPWDTRLPPLGITYLDSYLRTHGVDAQVWDCNIDTFLRFRMDQAVERRIKQARAARNGRKLVDPLRSHCPRKHLSHRLSRCTRPTVLAHTLG